jgi:large subunit ribosomal protein L4
MALQAALAEKAKASELGVFETIAVGAPKTKEAQQILAKAGIAGRTLIVVDRQDKNLAQAFRNIKAVELVEAAQINAWQLMASRKVYFTTAALSELSKRWPKG